MSHAAPWGRATPRWSVAGGGQSELPASMAGLPARRAWVWVGPPLFARGPSMGSVLLRWPVPEKPQVLALSRLWPLDVTVPLQLAPGGPLPATMVFLRFAVL